MRNMVSASYLINPWRMREGYGSSCCCVCVSVTALAATYLIGAIRLLWRFQDVWLSLKMLCPKVLAMTTSTS